MTTLQGSIHCLNTANDSDFLLPSFSQCKVIRALSSRGVAVSVGHSVSTLEQGEVAVRSGARLITHLFNAMLSFHHRDPGLIGLLVSQLTCWHAFMITNKHIRGSQQIGPRWVLLD